jgi:DNA mismatch endonuclease (patch repair protein)
VFPRRRIVVFVDGDFWHGRNWHVRRHRISAGANAEYWTKKIEYNMERDRRQVHELEASGWTVVRIWEGDIYSDVECAAHELEMMLSTQDWADRNS